MGRVVFSEEQFRKTGLSVVGSCKPVVDQLTRKVPGNKKVLNATNVEIDGIHFASKLEAYAYNLLKVLKIDFQFQVEYELQEKFIYNDKAVMAAKIIVDFYIPIVDWIMDTKGFATAKNKLQVKLLKHKLFREGRTTAIHLPSSTEEVEALANKILEYEVQKKGV